MDSSREYHKKPFGPFVLSMVVLSFKGAWRVSAKAREDPLQLGPYSLYELKPKKYFDLYKTIDKVSKIAWWNEIIQNNGAEIKKAFSQHQI